MLYFNTNKPHSFFFCRIPVVLENRRSSQGGEGVPTPCTLPLDPPLKVLALSLSSQTNVSYSFRTGSVLLSLLYFLVICFTIFQKSLDPLTFLRNLSFQYSASTFLMTLFTSFPKDMHISFPVFLTTRFLKLA